MKTIHKTTNNTLSQKIISVLIRYIKTQLLLIGCVSVAVWVILSYLGVKFFLLLAMMTGALSVIPVAGMMSAALVTALISMLDGSRFLPEAHPLIEGLIIILIYGILNFMTDYILSPLITGRITNIHPLILFFSVIIGTLIFGIPGTFLSIPVVLVIKTIVDERQ